MPAPVRVQLFASAREAVGRPVVDWPAPREGVELRELLLALVREHPALKPVLRVSRIVRQGSYVRTLRGRVFPGEAIAVHPPYSGG